MAKLGLETHIVDKSIYAETLKRFKERNIKLPTFSELANPTSIPASIQESLKKVDVNEAHPLNLFRIHWYNDPKSKSFASIPHHIVLGKEITGVDAPIVVMVGANFPMITAHKVLAAYSCLAPRIVTGQFNPVKHRAIWPSTGNYCRGGVAVSRIMDCHGVAILPEEMSQERFDWLNKWTIDPKKDIIKTYGCESNVKEIYDACNELEKNPENIIFNQFCEFGNALGHYTCTGKAMNDVFEHLKKSNPKMKARAFISATGSAGTISAGDYLKEKHNDFKIVAVEAVECPTLLNNGFGAHNIQGIGDKHVPYVHNVMNTDFVVAVSDANTDNMVTLFNHEIGRNYLIKERGLSREKVDALSYLGISSIGNVIAAIKLAKYYKFGKDDVLLTVATDPATMYSSEVKKTLEKYYNNNYSTIKAAESFGQYMMAVTTDHMEELSYKGRERIFNLGYYTWVEQQGVSIEDFNARKDPEFWHSLRAYVPKWDKLITEFNNAR
ncbi:MAG: pyridoxal-5'-phosphate-dependent protein subunit beta [Bdellovibrio sp.]|nr:pyridoxal-5'-phosphate-dependent protein subunit beta [Bdellovibrio sp.]